MDSHSTDNKTATIPQLAARCLAVICILLPFHAFLTVAIASVTGHYDLLRLWKELLLLLLLPVAVGMAWKSPDLRRDLRKGWLFWAMSSYAALTVILGVVALAKGQVNSYALGYALIINLRPLLIFFIAYVVCSHSRFLRDRWVKILLVPAVIVIAFGFLQAHVLPPTFLQHFGYSDATIAPYETVDQKIDYLRVQSTLRGANPLGAYMVLVLSAVVVLLMKSKRDKWQIAGITVLSAGLIVLVSTYSRSAYVGMALAALTAVLLVIHGRKAKKRLAIGLVVLAVAGAGSLFALRSNKQFENTFFHTDETSTSAVSSNTRHASALHSAFLDVVHEPFGRGPGTAGPASAHNNAPARIAENYYLQIGQETGWLGMALFIAIIIGLGRRLFAMRHDALARTLLSSLVGISFINLALHAWADDTLALLWWGLAGAALVHIPVMHNARPAILKSDKSRSESNPKIQKQP